ncbi:MAG: hypothetical protein ACE37J_05000 [Pikeienuella sp.]|uniref:hypothetical protein n=1 Tax=Pikeienuella sp. TaxID=2831957 RepID=UPI00391D009D
MGGKEGGTQMWCPYCKRTRVCAAKAPAKKGKTNVRRLHYVNHPDINFFRRGRQCQICGTFFHTSEVEEDFLIELMKLRDQLSEIKSFAEKYKKDAAIARGSLDDLSIKLDGLSALK